MKRATFLNSTIVAAAGAGVEIGSPRHAIARELTREGDREPFYGVHQAGIATPQQRNTYFAAFDLTATRRTEVIALLRAWTQASARMTVGQTAQPLADPLKPAVPPAHASATLSGAYGASANSPASDVTATLADTGEALGLPASRLTLTFGFGPGLFTSNGADRYGLAKRRPEALVDLPHFAGDELAPDHTGGDLSVQACADDPQVAFHAVRQLARIADGAAQIRWVQAGFLPEQTGRDAPRNLIGFRDVWADSEDGWMRDGTYLVARRIRIAIEHWDRMTQAFQEQTIGRHKVSGAPIGGHSEFQAPNLKAVDGDGNPLVAENAHIRLAAPESNGSAQILRRGYAYNDGVNMTAERWPPWRQGLEYDAGLLFLAYQRDPRTGFIKIFDRLSKFDMMNQFVTHVGGGIFACPPGIAHDAFVGQRLFEA
jgi:deferrochelatase/peroxidase EfeB